MKFEKYFLTVVSGQDCQSPYEKAGPATWTVQQCIDHAKVRLIDAGYNITGTDIQGELQSWREKSGMPIFHTRFIIYGYAPGVAAIIKCIITLKSDRGPELDKRCVVHKINFRIASKVIQGVYYWDRAFDHDSKRCNDYETSVHFPYSFWNEQKIIDALSTPRTKDNFDVQAFRPSEPYLDSFTEHDFCEIHTGSAYNYFPDVARCYEGNEQGGQRFSIIRHEYTRGCPEGGYEPRDRRHRSAVETLDREFFFPANFLRLRRNDLEEYFDTEVVRNIAPSYDKAKLAHYSEQIPSSTVSELLFTLW
jgi:hypothetical protein